ncbi:hypothetical protein L9F63_000615, partial [Diploptera punctata]
SNASTILFVVSASFTLLPMQEFNEKAAKKITKTNYNKVVKPGTRNTTCHKCLLCHIKNVISNASTQHSHDVEVKAIFEFYLSQFGYLSPQARNIHSGALISVESVKKAVSEFQAFAGLNITGELDYETRHTMSLPRCGVQDIVGRGGDSRTKRYALQGSRWRVKQLTYKITKYPRSLPASEVDMEIHRALGVWGAVIPLNFTRKTKGSVHIEIRFEKGEHGDGDPFDGPGGTLAHAFYPFKGGDAHFDETETWTIGSDKGTNLLQAATHEFGHALGLSHSDVKTSLMAPFYRGYQPQIKLDVDDILGIQALYGKRPQTDIGPKEVSKPTGKEDPKLCKDASFDTIFNSSAGDIYVFKGKHYWKLAEKGITAGYPQLISKAWVGLPDDIDAAFTHQNGKTYFFKGSEYWKYVGKKMDGDYPKKISEGFPGIPDNLDAALVWGGNGKFYFFKGSQFWRFDPTQKPPVRNTYPKLISSWEGIPNNLDAILTFDNGFTYFFKKGQYYRFDDFSFAVDAADPPFPRPVSYWWFGCKDEALDSLVRRRGDDLDSRESDVDDLMLDADDARNTPHDTLSAMAKDSAGAVSREIVMIGVVSLLVIVRTM